MHAFGLVATVRKEVRPRAPDQILDPHVKEIFTESDGVQHYIEVRGNQDFSALYLRVQDLAAGHQLLSKFYDPTCKKFSQTRSVPNTAYESGAINPM